MQEYYKKENLRHLKEIAPEMYNWLANLANITHNHWSQLQAFPDTGSKNEILLEFLEFLDLIDQITDAFRTTQNLFKKSTKSAFFNRIENFNSRKAKIMIMLAMYQDLKD